MTTMCALGLRSVGDTGHRPALLLGDATAVLSARGQLPLALGGATTGAPGAFGTGRRIEAATTNLITNPSFETNTTGWAPRSGGSLTRQAGGANGSWECAFPAGGIQSANIAVAAGDVRTLSVWANLPLGVTFNLQWNEYDAGLAFLRYHLAALVGTGAYARYALSATIGASSTTMVAYLYDNAGSVGGVCDAWQLEAGTYATSACDGSLGTGYAWTGTAHASTSTRAAGSVAAPGGVLGLCRGAAAAWLRPPWAGAAPGEHVVLHALVAGGDEVILRHLAGNWRLETTRGGASSSVTVAAGHAAGTSVFVYGAWDERRLQLRVDAVAAEATLAGGAADQRPQIVVGSRADVASGHLDGVLDTLGLASRPLTPGVLERLHCLTRRATAGDFS